MTAPKPGDRVRYVLEGYVDDAVDLPHAPGAVVLASQPPGSGLTAYYQGLDPRSPLIASVEVLPPPEPHWQRGDVVAVDYPQARELYLCLGGDQWQNITPDSRGRIGAPYTAQSGFKPWPHVLLVRDGIPQ